MGILDPYFQDTNGHTWGLAMVGHLSDAKWGGINLGVAFFEPSQDGNPLVSLSHVALPRLAARLGCVFWKENAQRL